jgi:hypothetical protein
MKVEIPEDIKEWSFWLNSGILGKEKLPLCPWAKKAILDGSVECFENEVPELLVPFPEGIKVRILLLDVKTLEDVVELRNTCNQKFKDWIFLDSHPEDESTIGGIKSTFKSPLLLIQPRKDLEDARKILERGNYYSYWDPNVLKDILSL